MADKWIAPKKITFDILGWAKLLEQFFNNFSTISKMERLEQFLKCEKYRTKFNRSISNDTLKSNDEFYTFAEVYCIDVRLTSWDFMPDTLFQSLARVIIKTESPAKRTRVDRWGKVLKEPFHTRTRRT